MRKIILASGSPRRKQLLAQLIGNRFEVRESDYEEDNSLGMEPLKLALHHALQKGRDAAKSLDSGIVIAADTFVVFENNVIGKPHTEEKARQVLKKISGNVIEVISGLAVIDVDNKKEIQEHEITKVKIKDMSDEEIEDYVRSGEPLDKAGAFGIQGKGAVIVEKIEGCYFNVVGLPLFRLSIILEQMGISVLGRG